MPENKQDLYSKLAKVCKQLKIAHTRMADLESQLFMNQPNSATIRLKIITTPHIDATLPCTEP